MPSIAWPPTPVPPKWFTRLRKTGVCTSLTPELLAGNVSSRGGVALVVRKEVSRGW